MGSPLPSSLPLARLAGIGAVVFLANAALLILQLVASRLLAPFIGSDLYSWTCIIGVFLTGIALGNALGGKLADRSPSPKTLGILLLLGAAAAAWMALAPLLFRNFYRSIPLDPRIPILTTLLCLPAGFFLSLLTPLAIKLGLPDVSKTGRVAGMVFALSTLGCLLGNYLTGFYLIPAFTINVLVYFAAGTLLALAVAVFAVLNLSPPPQTATEAEEATEAAAVNPHAFADIRVAFAVVFLASFCGMALELAASRIIAERLGVSLFTWTGVIGVMLAGTALGNLTGGFLADRVNRPSSRITPQQCLAGSLIIAGAACIAVLLTLTVLSNTDWFDNFTLVRQVLAWTFSLFFFPMFALGTISPQVIRLAVPDVRHVGSVAGRVYAWSTAGAIAGTFVAGYFLIAALTVKGVIIAIAFGLGGASLLVLPVWKENILLYMLAIVLGGATGGALLNRLHEADDEVLAIRETNYYNIKVIREYKLEDDERRYTGELYLYLDHLLHSSVRPDRPDFIHYEHEHIQMEFLRAARAESAEPKMLVIGGGGYTFPRYAKTVLPETQVDVVEIDPGVTRVAYEFLGLRKELGLRDFNMDGRQFVAERAGPHSYDLVVQDAVNDFSVPSHLLTKEYNDAVKAALKSDGVYLLTIIDEIDAGKIWRASMATLRQSFAHVALLATGEVPGAQPPAGAAAEEIKEWEGELYGLTNRRHVFVIYASDRPLNAQDLLEKNVKVANLGKTPLPFYTHVIDDAILRPFLDKEPGLILTDQFAPVDNLMADVFKRR
ncbi:MAG TPA: fused MFS/spermidine synthase [Gemmataceae bacterium]|jgi:spermidine synthase/MFS family permease